MSIKDLLDLPNATGTQNGLEHWVEGGKPCPKCGSFHTQKDISACLTTYPCQYYFRCITCSHTWTDHEFYDGGLTYQPQSEDISLHKEYGWICPKCGRVYSPSTSQCFYCGGGLSPNIVYCGPNSAFPAKDVMDNVSICSNPTVSVSTNEIINKAAEEAMRTVSQMRPVE